MSVINTNITSMIAQQNLNSSENSLSTSIERLSSGLKINSASDDAAGQAIANRMTSQITGLSQASSNASDGISLAQTTEGALDQVNDNLQRIRELSVQAANGTNSQSDMQSIQDEITQRLDEINRISSQTAFNGVDVLSKDQTITIQVGANDNETIDIKLSEINSKTLGLSSFNVNGYDTTLTASTLKDSSGATITSTNTSYVDKSGTTVSGGTLQVAAQGGYAPRLGPQPGGLVAVIALVSLGQGIAVVPASMVGHVSLPGVVYRPLRARHLRDIELSCLYRTDDASPMLAAFLDVVRAFAAEQKTQPNVNGPG